MARGRREIEVFNLSFLDLLSCGLGSMMLLFVLAAMLVERQGKLKLEAAERASEEARQRATELRKEAALQESFLATALAKVEGERRTTAQTEVGSVDDQVAKLQEEVNDLQLQLEDGEQASDPGLRLPKDPALLFLVDASGSMQAPTQEGVKRLASGETGSKWRRVRAFVEHVLRANPSSRFRVFAFNEGIQELSGDDWRTASEEEIARTLGGLESIRPHGGSDLASALRHIGVVLEPLLPEAPRVYLVTDALPNFPIEGSKGWVMPEQRVQNLQLARQVVDGFGRSCRWVIVLLPWEDEPGAAERYWQDFLPGFTGSVVVLPADWP